MKRVVRARVLHLLVLVAGVAAFGWALFAPVATVRCHDVLMKPGDVCSYVSLNGVDNGQKQSYEQRIATEQSARPVIAVVGLGVATFGGVLLWSAMRRKESLGQ